MNRCLKLVLAFAVLTSASIPGLAQVTEMNSVESAESWRDFYFYGLARTDPATIQLDSNSLMGLFSATGVKPAIASLAVIDPKHIINSKRLTPWLFLFVKVRVSAADTLTYVASGKGFSFLPAENVRGVFGSEINWPKEILERHPFDFSPRRPFILPFILPRSASAPPALTQSLVAPDGSFEVFGVAEFEEQRPEQLLASFSALSKEARPKASSR